jgi:hypothetical protein
LDAAGACDFKLSDTGFPGVTDPSVITTFSGRIDAHRREHSFRQEFRPDVIVDVVQTPHRLFARRKGRGWVQLDLDPAIASGEENPAFAVGVIPIFDPVQLLERASDFGKRVTAASPPSIPGETTVEVSLADLVPPRSPTGLRIARDFPATTWQPVLVTTTVDHSGLPYRIHASVRGTRVATTLVNDVDLALGHCVEGSHINSPRRGEVSRTVTIGTKAELQTALAPLFYPAD